MNIQIKDETENLKYLERCRFEKFLPKLIKQLKGKKVIIYGAALFHIIKKNYDISGINIIGVADKKYESSSLKNNEEGYRIYKMDEISNSGANYILVATKFYANILLDLYTCYRSTNIKVKPLVKKSFFTLLREL